jgi:hypothetical protein
MEDAKYDLAHVVVATPEKPRSVEREGPVAPAPRRSRPPTRRTGRRPREGGRIGRWAKQLKGRSPRRGARGGRRQRGHPHERGLPRHQVLGITAPRQRLFEDVKDDTRSRGAPGEEGRERDRWVATLRKAARVEINEAGSARTRRAGRSQRSSRRSARKGGVPAAADAAADAPAPPAACRRPHAPATRHPR